MRPPTLVAEAVDLLRLPQVRIEMSGNDECRLLYDAFTRRHARWRVIQNKSWGAALVRLPDRHEDYLAATSQLMRRQLKRAAKAGYTFACIDPADHVSEVLEINRSTSERQGRPMHPDYFDEAAVRRNFEHAEEGFGVFDGSGVLRAYLTTRTCGELAYLLRFLGHRDALHDGVMYLLISGAVEQFIERRAATGLPMWFMYDMFPGGTEGLRTFKHVIGCRPYRVSWSWHG
jgi:hypothetical protein